ncbi:helix-turn-helix domain-containing protein [Streptomyces sp. NBC_00271]|uniref:helix-turn-helix domain-containing protein n=1 Tax=Streptomyces sp. NBC_00271 TaxID=2975697 RepID=UPI002E2D293A|nr:helix-turn-helix domain-containing protein [Streptomyces sp. NBC_00271]
MPVGQRPAYWREALSRTFSAVDIVLPDNVYSGTIRTSQLGSLRVATVECDGLYCVRNSRLISQGNSEDVIVRLQGRGVARLEQGAREVYLHPGEIVLYDMTRPHRMDFPEPQQTKSLVLPRRLLGLEESDLQRLTAIPIRPDTALGALLSPFLSRLVDTAQTYPSHIGELLARNAVDLLTALADERLGRRTGETPGADRALLVRIQAYIGRHLADPDLTPKAIARTHHISERYLHKLFEQTDVTVGRWIQRRRVEECRRELAHPEAAGHTVAALARRWGFTSAAHFSRVFRAVYGMSPREWRDAGSMCGVSKTRSEPLDPGLHLARPGAEF